MELNIKCYKCNKQIDNNPATLFRYGGGIGVWFHKKCAPDGEPSLQEL